jgi:hypothetical protein
MTSLFCCALFLGIANPVAVPVLEPGEKDKGFVPLFNGKDLTGWKEMAGNPHNWVVEDGMLVCAGKGGGWLGTTKSYANFVLRLEYRLLPHGNSGVYLRAPEKGWISRAGMEIQILDDAHPKYASLKPYQFTGSLYHVVPAKRGASRPAGQWNQMEIRAQGQHIEVKLNGKTITKADLKQALKDPAVAREHTGLKRASGQLGLQSHSERVEFRKIRIKELPAPGGQTGNSSGAQKKDEL